MSKRYSKEEVVELMYEYRRYAWSNGCSKTDCYRWLKDRGFVGEPNNKRKQYSVQDEIERKEREMVRKELDRDKLIELFGKGAMDGISKEWVDGRDSLDKVMKAIERAEEKIKELDAYKFNSRISIAYDSIANVTKRVNKLEMRNISRDFKEQYKVKTWWSRLWNNNN